MNVNGPIDSDKIYRINAIPKDPADDESRDSKKRKRGHFRGREWCEEEDNIGLNPLTTGDIESKQGFTPTENLILLEQAKKDLAQLTTLEEKIAQLFFWKSEASYDPEVQHEAEDAILRAQVGGIYFTHGNYKREAYLIEHYQNLSKTPLIICNGFLHALSLYFEEDNPLPKRRDNNIQMAIDLGKTIMGQNRALKVSIQCASDFNETTPFFNEEEERAFAKGIKDAQGILGKVGKAPKSSINSELTSSVVQTEIQFFEMGGTRTIHFFDLSQEENFERVVELLNSRFDAFLVSKDLREIIDVFSSLIQSGKVAESTLDKKVLKILLMKRMSA